MEFTDAASLWGIKIAFFPAFTRLHPGNVHKHSVFRGETVIGPGQFPVDAADRSLRRTSKNASPVGGLAVGVQMPF